MMGHFARADVAPKQKLVEFKVSKNAMIPVGTKIFAEHFRPGQFIDVRGKTYVAPLLFLSESFQSWILSDLLLIVNIQPW